MEFICTSHDTGIEKEQPSIPYRTIILYPTIKYKVANFFYGWDFGGLFLSFLFAHGYFGFSCFCFLFFVTSLWRISFVRSFLCVFLFFLLVRSVYRVRMTRTPLVMDSRVCLKLVFFLYFQFSLLLWLLRVFGLRVRCFSGFFCIFLFRGYFVQQGGRAFFVGYIGST